jgi:FkbM family methyltransferase
MTAPAPAYPFPQQKQAPAGWTYLDYPSADILIQATTKWEKGFRRECTAKEPWTVVWIEQMPADAVLWNVGANVGSYVLIAAHRGVYTVAIEPGYASYAALANNVLCNRLEGRVTPLCVALSDRSGVVPLAYRSTEAGAASHGFGVQDAPKSVATVPTLTLTIDALAEMGLPAPSHLLIDVDGAEPAVLAGGPVVLSEYVRSVMIEVQDGQAEQIAALLSSWGFTERERFDTRGGKLMAGLHYAVWERG